MTLALADCRLDAISQQIGLRISQLYIHINFKDYPACYCQNFNQNFSNIVKGKTEGPRMCVTAPIWIRPGHGVALHGPVCNVG